MLFDIRGRIRNIQLPDGKQGVLYSVYECVSNSLRALEEKFGEDNLKDNGRIDIIMNVNRQGQAESIDIIDNGVGLTEDNQISMKTSDSMLKYSVGGKGVGRFVWFKSFEDVFVESCFINNSGEYRKIYFQFDIYKDGDPFADFTNENAPLPETYTKISLKTPRSIGSTPIKPSTFAKELAMHFFTYFIANNLPKITINYRSYQIDLDEFILEKIVDFDTSRFSIEFDGIEQTFLINHVIVHRNVSARAKNAIHLTGHKRLVAHQDIERKYALNQLPDGNAYVGVVNSTYLDNNVDQERTGFKLKSEHVEKIIDSAINEAGEYLSDHIFKIRQAQKRLVNSILSEHPQLYFIVKNIDDYVETLSPGMDEEAIGQSLFTLLYRDEKKITRAISQISQSDNLSDTIDSEVNNILQNVSDMAKGRLASYIVKRRQILDMVRAFLRIDKDNPSKFHPEKALHDLVIPMGQFYETEDYGKHNLWIVDDTLSFYQFFASDKALSTFSEKSPEARTGDVKEDGDRKEPDIIFFNPMGFHREGTSDPVTIVEFKRPGDETPSQDPVGQILTYVEKLQDRTIRKPNGDLVSSVSKDTPFHCYVICELTEGTRRLLERSIAQQMTPDREGYIGYSRPHNALLTVISYQKMLRDAELRNKAFFAELGLIQR